MDGLDLILDIASWVLLMAGAVFYLVGCIGLIRMPDVFTRMHALSVAETAGVIFLVAGMMLQAGLTLVTVKLAIILATVLLTAPVASHALARAALFDGKRPLLAQEDGSLAETDCGALFPELGERLSRPLTSETPEGEAPLAAARAEGGASSS